MKYLKEEEQRFFPFVLGNGTDCVLIDYSGSMACNSGHLHMEQHQGAICAWHKGTHRDRKKAIAPLLQSDFTLFHGEGEACEIGSFDQCFDPQKAILATKAESKGFKIEVRTFLSSEHFLVEHYTIKEVPKDKPALSFNLHPPYAASSFLKISADSSYKFIKTRSNNSIDCGYEVNGIKGQALMHSERPSTGKNISDNGGRLVFSNLEKGESFTKYLVLLDESDGKDYKKRIIRIHDKIKQYGYEKILKAHEDEWKEYYRQSSIDLPDKKLEYLYYLSLYLIRANQNRKTGLISLGNYPVLWGGGVSDSFDLFFPHSALLGANRIKEAEALISGYAAAIPLAREYAEKSGCKGAYFPWFMNYKGESLNFTDPKEYPMIEKYNNGCLVMESWNQYLYSGDMKFLKKYWHVIKETTDFLLSSIVSEDEKTAFISRGQGADESAPRTNDSSHLFTTIKSLEALTGSAGILGKKISPAYQKTLEKLKKSAKNNYKKGILFPYKGATGINTSMFTFYLFNLPEGITKGNIEKALKECRGELGLSSPGNYRNLIWPWAEFQAAIVLSHLKDKRAFEHLCNGAKYCSSSGALPEKIRPDGFPINYWFLTAHGTYVWAVNSMLGHAQGDKLRIVPGIPGNWQEISFKNLRLSNGLLLSLKMKNGKICGIRLKNTTCELIKANLEIPEKYLDKNFPVKAVEIKAGQELSLTGRAAR